MLHGGLQATQENIPGQRVIQALRPQFKLQLLESSHITGNTAQLFQVEQFRAEFDLSVNVGELITEAIHDVLQLHLIKNLERVSTETPPPSQRIVAQVRYKKPAGAIAIPQTHALNILAHHEEEILKFPIRAIKSWRLVQLDLPRDQVRPLMPTTTCLADRTLHRRCSKNRATMLHSLHTCRLYRCTWYRLTCNWSGSRR